MPPPTLSGAPATLTLTPMFSPYLIPHLGPLFAMVALCFIVAGIFTYRRLSTLAQHPKGYFQLVRNPSGVAGEVPVRVEQASRNFINLFELPVLFYVATFLLLELRIQDETTLLLSWGFVVSRFVHSFIHLGANNIRFRALSFWFSGIFLISLLAYLAFRIFFWA